MRSNDGPPEGGILRVRLYSVSNLPTNGYGRSSIEYGLWLTRTGNLPPNKRAPVSTPTTARVASRIDLWQSLAEKFAEAGLLVSSNAKPTAWPDLILSGFVWPDPVCGLSDTWPVQLLAD